MKNIVYVLIVFLVFILSFIRIGKVSGNSMYPTLKSGEYFVYLNVPYFLSNLLLKKGDIVLYNHYYEDKGEVRFVKRIKCLPGYFVYKLDNGVYDCSKYGTGKVLTGYFLIGDNKKESLDSRYCFSYGGCKYNKNGFSIDKKEILGKLLVKFDF